MEILKPGKTLNYLIIRTKVNNSVVNTKRVNRFIIKLETLKNKLTATSVKVMIYQSMLMEKIIRVQTYNIMTTFPKIHKSK